MKRRTLARLMVGASFIAMLGALFFSNSQEAAVNTRGVNGAATYTAVSNPILLVASIALVALYIWVLRLPLEQVRSSKAAGLWRRLLAFLTDYFFAVFIVMPWTWLIALLIEAIRTGHFAWAVQREALPQDEWLTVTLVLLNFLALLAYFALPPRFMSATPGSTLFGIAVLDDSGKAPSTLSAFSRPILAFLALCLWPLSVPLALSNPDKRMWQDIRCGTRVVRWTD